jgi:hypothetical protein
MFRTQYRIYCFRCRCCKRETNIFGFFFLISFWLVKESEVVGSLREHKVKKMTGFEIVPMLSGMMSVVTPTMASDEQRYLELLKLALFEPAFYFCSTHDITRTLRHVAVSDTPTAVEIITSADEQFWWNKHLLTSLLDAKVSGAVSRQHRLRSNTRV